MDSKWATGALEPFSCIIVSKRVEKVNGRRMKSVTMSFLHLLISVWGAIHELGSIFAFVCTVTASGGTSAVLTF